MCVLLGFGADAVCPYMVFEIMAALREEKVLDETFTDKVIFTVSENTFMPAGLDWSGVAYSQKVMVAKEWRVVESG